MMQWPGGQHRPQQITGWRHPACLTPRVVRGQSAAAFTALELLVATCLASLLMVAVLHVLGRLHAEADAMRSYPGTRVVELRLTSQLRWDFEHAQSLQWSPQEIRLNGYAGRSFDGGRITHCPVEIRYALRSRGGRWWLIRQERQLDARSRRGVDVQLVCGGISGFEIGTLLENVPLGMEEQPVPDRLQLTLHRSTGAKPLQIPLVLR